VNNRVRMTPEDSAFWRMESEIRRMHSVTVAVCSGPAPSFDELTDRIAQRIPLVPRFRQRVAEVPFELGRPMWVDDPDFDVTQHVLAASLGTGEAGLSELVSLIVSEQLDRSRPLWQVTFVPGLPDGEWALLSKVHHSMIDGLFGTEPLAVLVDSPVNERASTTQRIAGTAAVRWQPGRMPRPDELFGQTLAELIVNPAEQYRFARSQIRYGRRRFEAAVGRSATSTDRDGLRGPVRGARQWSSLSVDMSAMRTARSRFEANTHELILALITSGLRDLLISRDEVASSLPTVEAIVPVAVASSTTGFHNGLAAEVVELPTDEPELVDRIRRLHDQAKRASSNPVAIDAQIDMTGFSAAALASLGLREATRRGVAERGADTVVVNVPGPRHEVTVLGRPVVGIRSAPPLAAGVRVSFGVVSYRDVLSFGVTGDQASVPDIRIVTDGISHAIAELAEDTTGD